MSNARPSAGQRPSAKDEGSAQSELPGVPGFRTWRGLYIFVLVVFGLVVGALAIFSRVFA